MAAFTDLHPETKVSCEHHVTRLSSRGDLVLRPGAVVTIRSEESLEQPAAPPPNLSDATYFTAERLWDLTRHARISLREQAKRDIHRGTCTALTITEHLADGHFEVAIRVDRTILSDEEAVKVAHAVFGNDPRVSVKAECLMEQPLLGRCIKVAWECDE